MCTPMPNDSLWRQYLPSRQFKSCIIIYINYILINMHLRCDGVVWRINEGLMPFAGLHNAATPKLVSTETIVIYNSWQ